MTQPGPLTVARGGGVAAEGQVTALASSTRERRSLNHPSRAKDMVPLCAYGLGTLPVVPTTSWDHGAGGQYHGCQQGGRDEHKASPIPLRDRRSPARCAGRARLERGGSGQGHHHVVELDEQPQDRHRQLREGIPQHLGPGPAELRFGIDVLRQAHHLPCRRYRPVRNPGRVLGAAPVHRGPRPHQHRPVRLQLPEGLPGLGLGAGLPRQRGVRGT